MNVQDVVLDSKNNNPFPWYWKLENGYPTNEVNYHGKTVFSCFSGGGGSTMGYKLAGFNVIGGCDIDSKMAELYKVNHKPKYFFTDDIRKLKDRDLPDDLYNLSILDASPPCTMFSLNRRSKIKDYFNKEKKFVEGQKKQRLDDLVFHFLDLAGKLKPKIILIENVKGLTQGKAKGYVIEIFEKLDNLGYENQFFLLNAASMGVPQKRERVFIIARKKKLLWKNINLTFNQKSILFKEVHKSKGPLLNTLDYSIWKKRKIGNTSFSDILGKNLRFNSVFIYADQVCNTLAASAGSHLILFNSPHLISDQDKINISTFPQDFNFLNKRVQYVTGMTVPPVMMANISYQVYLQWLKGAENEGTEQI